MIIETKFGKKYKGIGIAFPSYYKLFQPLIWNYFTKKWDQTGTIVVIHKCEVKKVY